MIFDTDPLVLLYSFVTFIVIVSLAVSRTRSGAGHDHFFSAPPFDPFLSASTFFISSALVFIILAAAAAPFLREHPAGFAVLSVALLAGIAMGALLRDASERFRLASSRPVQVLLAVHGFVFTAAVQLLMLLVVGDMLLTALAPGRSVAAGVFMIAAAGIYALVGGVGAVMVANIVAAVSVTAALLLLAFGGPFQTGGAETVTSLFVAGEAAFAHGEMTESGPLLIALGIMLMTAWTAGLEPGTVERMRNSVRRPVLAAAGGSVLALLFAVTILVRASDGSGTVPAATSADGITTVLLLTGMTALYALTFQSSAAVAALRWYPLLAVRPAMERQQLIGRLTTAAVAAAAVLLQTFARFTGSSAVVWFTEFLSLLAVPVTAAALFTAVQRNGRGASAAFAAGIIYGAAVLFVSAAGSHISIAGSISPYGRAVESFAVSVIAGAVRAWLPEPARFRGVADAGKLTSKV